MSELDETIKRRHDATLRIIKALAHLDHEKQISIITSFISITELESIADFQERE